MGGRPRFLGLELDCSIGTKTGAFLALSHPTEESSVEISFGESRGGGSSKLEQWDLGRPLFRAESDMGWVCFGSAKDIGEAQLDKQLEGADCDSSLC